MMKTLNELGLERYATLVAILLKAVGYEGPQLFRDPLPGDAVVLDIPGGHLVLRFPFLRAWRVAEIHIAKGRWTDSQLQRIGNGCVAARARQHNDHIEVAEKYTSTCWGAYEAPYWGSNDDHSYWGKTISEIVGQ